MYAQYRNHEIKMFPAVGDIGFQYATLQVELEGRKKKGHEEYIFRVDTQKSLDDIVTVHCGSPHEPAMPSARYQAVIHYVRRGNVCSGLQSFLGFVRTPSSRISAPPLLIACNSFPTLLPRVAYRLAFLKPCAGTYFSFDSFHSFARP